MNAFAKHHTFIMEFTAWCWWIGRWGLIEIACALSAVISDVESQAGLLMDAPECMQVLPKGQSKELCFQPQDLGSCKVLVQRLSRLVLCLQVPVHVPAVPLPIPLPAYGLRNSRGQPKASGKPLALDQLSSVHRHHLESNLVDGRSFTVSVSPTIIYLK